MTLYIFNPEHDYALANNDPHFMAPASACQFADECASFLPFIADADEVAVFRPYSQSNASINFQEVTRVVPWGWDRLVVHQLRESGVPEQCLPTESQLDRLRQLAHRRQTIPAMDFLREQCPDMVLPHSPVLLTTEAEIAAFVAENQDVLLKSPYSGNGRGNLYAHTCYSDTLRRQTMGVVRRQGAILGERMYDVVQDFAMEFLCCQGHASFAGYSLFNTLHYGYAGNLLMSDVAIEERLSHWLDVEMLQRVKSLLITYIDDVVASSYEGYVGVDMFVYQKDGKYYVNPMVEMNLRMTMGMAAHILYENHVHPEATGTMRLLYFPKPGDLKAFVDAQAPVKWKDGKWHSGFLALTAVTETSRYAVGVAVDCRQVQGGF